MILQILGTIQYQVNTGLTMPTGNAILLGIFVTLRQLIKNMVKHRTDTLREEKRESDRELHC